MEEDVSQRKNDKLVYVFKIAWLMYYFIFLDFWGVLSGLFHVVKKA